ncbi:MULTISPECIES: hypothetical protein [Curtobacterium]|uniref:hypothetical protein n=1 Tax=Curtobacterium flaccumfaciens TaxID=2035 RepID=UPI003EE4E2D0
MSSSDAHPPLSRRQARERERAAAAGGQPVTPPPTVAAPTSADGSEQARRRPGSHVAPAPSGAAQSGVPDLPPASATEIVPGTGGLTRRQLRLMREAEVQAVLPVPLQNPTPQSSDRTVQDVIGSVSTLEDDQAVAEPTPAASAPSPVASAPGPVGSAPSPVASAPTAASATAAEPPVELDEAAVQQATEADGSPDAVEPLEEAAAHAEEPRRHRSTWAPHDAEAELDDPADAEAVPAGDESAAAVEPPADASTGAPLAPKLPSVDAATPGVFPLSLDDDTNETPVQRPSDDSAASSSVPAAVQRPVEPKPVTTAFQPPAGHWSALAHDSNDAEVHDEETGTRRVAASNPNAIVLPNSALADPTGALNATGEVILTGSIDLPASLSSTGSHRPIDGAEVDRLLEQHDEQPETDASPIRASRAVSSHTSTRQVVLAAAKPKESKTPMVLAISVGAVGLSAAAVIIVALLTTHPFG